MSELTLKLRHGLIVSCQSEGDDPFNQPDLLAKFAKAAQMGGAAGIRAQGVENIKAIRQAVDLPIIGITKGHFENGWVCITPDFTDIENLVNAGADIVALDVTPRKRPNGMDGVEFFDDVRERFDIDLMADISTFEEGIRASEMGADLVATTLAGYTEYTEKQSTDAPDVELIERLSRAVSIPVIAEGRIWTPEQAKQALLAGAHAVVVGTAITRPRVVTRKFVDTMLSKIN
jgi:N-acylglucosamine-6-phosphate 2-epimerase